LVIWTFVIDSSFWLCHSDFSAFWFGHSDFL
jgi:hypothetical protein